MKDKIKYISVFLVMLSIAAAIAQTIDHKDVMLNQARRMTARRDFEDAIVVYEELLQRYPQDAQVLGALFNVLVTVNRYDEAETLLTGNEAAFSPETYVQNRIILLGRKGEYQEAERIGLEYLRKNPNIINLYRDFALSYERTGQFESAIKVLKLCREQTGDEYIFANEKARNYHRINRYSKAAAEYIKHLEKNTGFLFYVTDRIKNMLDQQETLINTIEDSIGDSENHVLLELYAMLLSHIEMYEEAYEVYSKLGPEKLQEFADEITAVGNYDIAVRAYEEYYSIVADPIDRANVKVKIASIQIIGGKLDKAKDTLLELTENQTIQDSQYRHRTHINREIREMLAELAIRMELPKEDVIYWLDEARTFAINRNLQQQVELDKVRYLTMIEDYEEADDILNTLKRAMASGTRINNLSFYYQFILELMQNGEPADSLLAELIINIPGEDVTNEALFLSVMHREIKSENIGSFLEAYRLKSLYKDEEAIYVLIRAEGSHVDIDDLKNIDEQIIMIAAQWADELGKEQLAEQLYLYPYGSDALAGYAALRLSRLRQRNDQDYRGVVTSFLTANPQNFISPKLRLLLTGS